LPRAPLVWAAQIFFTLQDSGVSRFPHFKIPEVAFSAVSICARLSTMRPDFG